MWVPAASETSLLFTRTPHWVFGGRFEFGVSTQVAPPALDDCVNGTGVRVLLTMHPSMNAPFAGVTALEKLIVIVELVDTLLALFWGVVLVTVGGVSVVNEKS